MPDGSTSAAAILFVSPAPHDHVLLVRAASEDRNGSWALPSILEAADVYVEPAVDFGDVLTARVEIEFEPVLGEKYDASSWLNCEFALSGPIDPSARSVLQRFSRARRLDQLIARIASEPYQTPQGDPMSSHSEFVSAQARADSVAQAFGDRAEPPLHGEALANYRRRLLAPFKQHNATWKDKDLARLDASILDIAEAQIHADALREANAPTNLPLGQLVERHTRDQAGRSVTRFFGDPAATWAPFKQPPRGLISIGGR
jgi:hypothetical protein